MSVSKFACPKIVFLQREQLETIKGLISETKLFIIVTFFFYSAPITKSLAAVVCLASVNQKQLHKSFVTFLLFLISLSISLSIAHIFSHQIMSINIIFVIVFASWEGTLRNSKCVFTSIKWWSFFQFAVAWCCLFASSAKTKTSRHY